VIGFLISLIDSYSYGKISVDGVQYPRDIVILPAKVKTDWFRRKGHELAVKDLIEILQEKPDLFVVGVGMEKHMKILGETQKWLDEQDIKYVAARTDEAVEIFNKALKQGKRVVGAFHIFC
jgi:hypothetical protein